MSEEKFVENFYDTTAYTADISTKMRIPEHINAHGSHANGDPFSGKEFGRQNRALYEMQVPDRIMLAGSDDHVFPKSHPRELQLEKNILPPTPEHVRVQTPPRSIKLGEVIYDSAPSTPQHRDKLVNGLGGPGGGARARIERGGSIDGDTSLRAGDSLESGLSVYDEVQMMRRQLAKLNHRLMAVELENQQQQQREMVLTVVVSAYFVVKALLWLNKSM